MQSYHAGCPTTQKILPANFEKFDAAIMAAMSPAKIQHANQDKMQVPHKHMRLAGLELISDSTSEA